MIKTPLSLCHTCIPLSLTCLLTNQHPYSSVLVNSLSHSVIAMRHINEARITIDLYLADTSTTLAYCYEAKVFDLGAALKQYTDSVALYTRHVGKEHLTVTHALLSIGCIHIELQQWGEAIRSLNDCLLVMSNVLSELPNTWCTCSIMLLA